MYICIGIYIYIYIYICNIYTSNIRCAVDREFVYIELDPQRRLADLLGALGGPCVYLGWLGAPRKTWTFSGTAHITKNVIIPFVLNDPSIWINPRS